MPTRHNFKTLRLVGILLVLILFAGISAGCNGKTESTPAPMPTPDSNSSYQSTSGGISANGVLLPARQVELGFGTAGRLETLAVKIGQSVRDGETLAALDAIDANLAKAQAEAELVAAQADYNLVASSLEANRKAAALELAEAQQALDALHEDAGLARAAALQAISEASEAVERASYLLYYYTLPADLAGLAPLEALQLARENLDRARLDYEPYINASSGSEMRQDLKEKLDRAQGDYNAAMRQVELEADLADAQARLEKATQDYQKLANGPDPDDIALAEARVANAQAQLDNAKSAATEQLALAQAQVDLARLNLEFAQAQLEEMTLSAPFDGVISALRIEEGEWVAPGATVIELLDLSGWRVETRNVGELQIGRVEIGQEVHVRVNAFQSETLSGRVISISPDAVVQQGDITYTLIIELEPTDLNLRPGMTARVEILVED